ncbi:vacuolar protein sorting 55-domain-containing protein [Favolaschia claudopus]|uniref:Vacuolar protein sorting 55-domain-containing protein n=1 Tax=Favolaschia claudopus TaxID=2862362 RepID=A0AAW0AP83_9AGAR
MVLAVGFLMIILSCVLYGNWLPLLVALIFVLAPLPNALFAHCGSDEFAGSYEGGASGPVDLGRFITAMVVTSGSRYLLFLPMLKSFTMLRVSCLYSEEVLYMGQYWRTLLLSDRKSQNSIDFAVY